MTKKDLILQHLINKGSITSLDSFRLYNATRLSGIIFNLKKEGYAIDSIAEKGKDCVYARYVYKGKIDRPYYQQKQKETDKKVVEPIIKKIKPRDNDEMLYDKSVGTNYLF